MLLDLASDLQKFDEQKSSFGLANEARNLGWMQCNGVELAGGVVACSTEWEAIVLYAEESEETKIQRYRR
jgi:hypothetical protein